VKEMRKIDSDELEILNAFEKGKLKSVATNGELAKVKAAARATAVKVTLPPESVSHSWS